MGGIGVSEEESLPFFLDEKKPSTNFRFFLFPQA
jgi:hypothetical protein